LYLRRILANLVSNAVQAMPNGGNLTISAFRQDGKALITVEDSGSGLSEDAKSRLFTPLFTTKSKGQGFGLAVVKKLTEAMGGAVTFDSEKGKGAKFILSFPV
jgi:two-component system, NtrC family, sensor histidine kinase HydH